MFRYSFRMEKVPQYKFIDKCFKSTDRQDKQVWVLHVCTVLLYIHFQAVTTN